MRLPLALAVFALTVVGTLSNIACSPTLAPVNAPASTAGMSPEGSPYSAAQVEQAVVQGAMAKGWTVVHRSPGLVVADIQSGGHGARVRILVNESGWRIAHEQSSPGLKHRVDERHGEVIHRRYNHWVRLLDESIRQALVMQSSGGAAPPVAPPSAAEPVPST